MFLDWLTKPENLQKTFIVYLFPVESNLDFSPVKSVSAQDVGFASLGDVSL